ncbi:MAG: hypothetical protein Kow0069_13290 [Promethearchaeota archaeon]
MTFNGLEFEASWALAGALLVGYLAAILKLRVNRRQLVPALVASLWPVAWESVIEVVGYYSGLWNIVGGEVPFPVILWASFLMGVRFYVYHLVLSLFFLVVLTREPFRDKRAYPLVVVLGMTAFGSMADFLGAGYDTYFITPFVWLALETGYYLVYSSAFRAFSEPLVNALAGLEDFYTSFGGTEGRGPTCPKKLDRRGPNRPCDGWRNYYRVNGALGENEGRLAESAAG